MIEPVHPGKGRLLQFLTLAVVLTLLTLGWLSWTALSAYRFVTSQLPTITRMEQLRGQILLFDEALTMSARMSAATADPQWEARYRRFEPQLDEVLKQVMGLAPEVATSRAAVLTHSANNKLVAMENRAFDLVRQGQQAGAEQLLSSEEYEFQKKVYAAGMAEFSGLLENTINSARARRQTQVFWSVVTAAISTPLLMLSWWFVLRAAGRWQTALVASNQQLSARSAEMEAFSRQLDEKVNERTKRLKESELATLNMMDDTMRAKFELEQTHNQLQQASGKLQVAHDEILELNRNLEHRVLERTAQLEAANRELESFSYSVSHDLRAPLRHIGGFLELLQKKAGPVLDAKCQRYVTMIAASTKEMGALIDDLLSFSRMGRAEMRATQLDLAQLTHDTIKESAADTAGREIVWKIAPLPQIQADPALMRQAMVNLISNALKYSRTRPRAEIEIGCPPDENGEHVFFVRDNGVGFDMKYADELFGLFQRLLAAEEFEGTGIGLAIVQRIIGRHGGRTWAEGVVDGGATFYFSIPKSPAIKL